MSDPLFKEKDFAEIAAQMGYRTISQVTELGKKDPELVSKIYRQMQLKLQHGFLTVELKLYSEIYPSITLSSLAIMAFAVFEQSLSLVCSALADMHNLKLGLPDLAGHSTLEKAQCYFTRVLGLKIEFARSSKWQRIKGHQDVRNLLAHNGGFLDDSERSERIAKFVKSNKVGLRIEKGTLQIDKVYVEKLVNDIQEWLIDLFDLIDSQSKAAS